MSLKCNLGHLGLLCVIFLSYKVVMSGCEVVLVNRNVIDSFRVGKDGCTNNARVCTSSATCQSDGSCLCSASKPNFRNPGILARNNLTFGDTYGCVRREHLRFGVGAVSSHCAFGPFQLVPYSYQDPATKFNDIENPNTVFKSCSLKKALAKFPDNATEMELEWLNDSYVDFTFFNNKTLDFKWKRTVPSLRGTIVTLHLLCSLQYSPATGIPKCLRAKVIGTWLADADPVPPETTITSIQPKSSRITSEATSFVTITTEKPKSTTSCAGSDVESSDLNKLFVVLLYISVVVIVILGIIIVFLCKKIQRMKNNNLRMKEMQNIDEQRRANPGNEISTYDEVLTDGGIRNNGIYDESIPSSIHNKNIGRLSDHNYEDVEEPSNYEPLRRNHLQDQSDEHNYQSLITSQKGN